MKDLSELTEQELLALAISLEEEDIRTYADLAEGMRESYPGTARMFSAMSEEEDGHRHRLLDLYRAKFGDHIPLIRRQDVRGFVERKAIWLLRPLGIDKVREYAEIMEAESKRFYLRAARHSNDAAIRQLLGDLAAEERRHEARAGFFAEYPEIEREMHGGSVRHPVLSFHAGRSTSSQRRSTVTTAGESRSVRRPASVFGSSSTTVPVRSIVHARATRRVSRPAVVRSRSSGRSASTSPMRSPARTTQTSSGKSHVPTSAGARASAPVLRGRVERFGMLGLFLVDRIGEGGGQTAVGPRSAVVLGWAARPPSMQRWTELRRDESKSSQCDKPKKPRLLAREDDSDENRSSLGDRRSGAQVPPQEPTG